MLNQHQQECNQQNFKCGLVSRKNNPVPFINEKKKKKEAEILQIPRDLKDISAKQGNRDNDWIFDNVKKL